MGQKQVVLCDTNIIIELYKNNSSIVSVLKSIGQENIGISVITSGELIYGALNKRELNRINKDIAHLSVSHIDKDIGEKSLQLLNRYSLSHNLGLPDGLIAATSIVKNMPLYTLNEKDFKFIEEIEFFS